MRDVCKWCNKPGHWEVACQGRFLGMPRATSVAASTSDGPQTTPAAVPATPQTASASITSIEDLEQHIESVKAQVAAMKAAGFS